MKDINLKHIIMFSGGASSAYVAKWVVDKYGKANEQKGKVKNESSHTIYSAHFMYYLTLNGHTDFDLL